MSIVFSLFFSVLLTTLLVPPMITLGKQIGMVDRPNPRKVHNGVIPRSGGLALILGMLAPFALLVKLTPFLVGISAGGLLILAIGLLDDLRDLGWRWKLAGQIAASFLSVSLSGLEFHRPLEFWPGYLLSLDAMGPLLSVLFLVACINCINLADGLDGLAGGMCLLIFASVGLLGYLDRNFPLIALSTCIIGALIGFLRYNTYPAIVFLGDTGSQFLGFLVGMAMICLTHGQQTYTPVLCLYLIGIPALDMLVVMLERLLDRRPLFQPDQSHLHHRMLRLGFKHHQAVIVEYAAQLAMILIGWNLRHQPDYVLLLVYLTIMTLAAVALLVGRKELRLPCALVSSTEGHPTSSSEWKNGKGKAILGAFRAAFARASWVLLVASLLLYYILTPLLLRAPAMELGLYALAFCTLILVLKCFDHNYLIYVVKLAAYFLAVVFIVSDALNPEHSWYQHFSSVQWLLFCIMGVSYFAHLVFTPDPVPTLTMDYLLLAVVVLISFLPASVLSEYRVHAIAAKILLVFLSLELVAFRLRDDGEMLLLGVVPSLSLHAGIALWPLLAPWE